VRKVDPDMPMFLVRTMRDLYTQMGIKTTNFVVQLVIAMGLTGMMLATVGLYGLVAYSVSRRTREIGIRMALGADRAAVLRMVLRQGIRLGVAGVAAGLVIAHYACRGVTSALDLRAAGPWIFAAIALPLIAVSVLASWPTARRASRVDPLIALREE
jgi:ABC-type antimicrobial peptide transport system permease subunit